LEARIRRIAVALVPALAACGGARPEPAPEPAALEPAPTGRVDTVRISTRDPALERDLADARLQLLEQQALIDNLQELLDEAQREVVRAMAKLQSSASRAEAASAMAEAELVLQSLRLSGEVGTDVERAGLLMARSSAEFNSANYGGALYWANHVKNVVAQRVQVGAGSEPSRPGETAFAVPVPMETSVRANVRDGPGTNFRVLFTLEKGAALTGQSHVGHWIRIKDDGGRAGWIHQGLVTQ
jgi:hypothetical protein